MSIRYVLALASTILYLSLNAQESKKMKFGLYAGGGVGAIISSEQYDGLDVSFKATPALNLIFEYQLNSWGALSTELKYSSTRLNADIDINSTHIIPAEINRYINNITWLLNPSDLNSSINISNYALLAKFRLNSLKKTDFGIGAYYSLHLNVKAEGNTSINVVQLVEASVLFDYSDSFNQSDYGICFDAFYNINRHFSMGVNGMVGLSDLSNDNFSFFTTETKHSYISLDIGLRYFF